MEQASGTMVLKVPELRSQSAASFPTQLGLNILSQQQGGNQDDHISMEPKQGPQCRQLSARPRLRDTDSAHPTLC